MEESELKTLINSITYKPRNDSRLTVLAEFKDITSKHCHYCNSEPSNKLERLASNGAFVYSGIDRIDSNVGYIPNNIVPCCSTCNQMKMEMSRQEFLDHIRLMVSRYDKYKRTA